MKILVVDDSRAMRAIVMRTIRQAGVKDASFAEAATSEQALAQIQDFEPELICCDWYLPGMQGIDLLRTLNKRKISIPLGFITCASSPEMMQLAEDAGARFFISKPFTAETLAGAIEASFAPR